MTLLVDTHAAIWYWDGDPQLSPTAKALIDDRRNHRYLSPATPWEVAVKVSIGKLKLGAPYPGYFPTCMTQTGLIYLPLTDDHFAAVAALPRHHGDPFDRMIIAQALVQNIPVVSADAALDAYGVTRLW